MNDRGLRLVFVLVAMVFAACDDESPVTYASYPPCAQDSDCPSSQPVCRTFALGDSQASFCTRVCETWAECADPSVGLTGECMRVDGAGMPDVAAADGICVRRCMAGAEGCEGITTSCRPIPGDEGGRFVCFAE